MTGKTFKARYNRVWRKIGGSDTLGNTVTLKQGETISAYEEVKPEKKPAEKTKTKAPTVVSDGK